MQVIGKSIGYVTRGDRILFFRATEAPDAGVELPGGTLEPGEDPRVGLLREVEEETGLESFGPPRLLGVVEFDADDGLDEIQLRHFFHLPLLGDAPESWTRVVEEGNGTFTFNFFWVRASEVPSDVRPGHDVFLQEVAESLRAG